MGRLLALLLGGVGILIFGPELVPGDVGSEVRTAVEKVIGEDWHAKLLSYGGGVLASIALILFAVRGRE